MKKQKFKLSIDADTCDRGTQRTIKASISSEYPVERFDGQEILDHSPEAVDLSRAPLALIDSHNANRLNVGLVEDLKVVGRKLRGKLRFGSRTEAREIWEDVKAGIIRYVSIGYQVISRERTETGYRVTRWQPFECSLVSVPADPTVGVGRSFSRKENRPMITKMTLSNYLRDITKVMESGTFRQLSDSDRAEIQSKMDAWDQYARDFFDTPPTFAESGFRGVWEYANRPLNDPPYGDDPNNTRQDPESEFRSAGEFFQCVARASMPGGVVDPRLAKRAVSGLSEGIASEGGFLVGTDVAREIYKLAFDTGAVASRCRKIPLSSNANGIKLPVVSETSRATGSRWGGIRVYWAAEGGTVTASKPKFGQLNLELEKLIGLCYATDELLADAAALESVLKQGFAEEIAFTVDDAIIRGTGAGQMLGILNSDALVTASKEVGQAATTFEYENVLKMWTRMPARNRKNAVWFINQDIEPELYSMTLTAGTGGSAVYTPAGGASVAPYASLFARPVIPIEHCSTLGEKGDVILADMSEYVLIDKGDPDFQGSMHVRFLYDEMTFRIVYRVDGQPMLCNPITPYKGSNTLSPFVTLEAR